MNDTSDTKSYTLTDKWRDNSLGGRGGPQRCVGEPVVGVFDGCFARQGFPLIDLDEATPLRITLLN